MKVTLRDTGPAVTDYLGRVNGSQFRGAVGLLVVWSGSIFRACQALVFPLLVEGIPGRAHRLPAQAPGIALSTNRLRGTFHFWAIYPLMYYVLNDVSCRKILPHRMGAWSASGLLMDGPWVQSEISGSWPQSGCTAFPLVFKRLSWSVLFS